MQKTLKSGVTVELAVAPFKVAKELFKVLANELKLVEVDLGTLDLSKIQNTDINAIKNAILQLAGSDKVEAHVFACLARCTYNGVKITPDTFEPEEARGDYLPCALEVIKINVVPFFSGLELPSQTSGAQAGAASQG